MSEPRDYMLYLEDIQTSMNRIQEYIADYDYDTFRQDNKTVDAVIRNFEIIGEATNKLPKAVQEQYPDNPLVGHVSIKE
ncbi:MAG: DUF86 domain-containing protein [Cyclobacteriaceae bacterium]